VVSGGQSGVDRAALDAAIACGLPYGGWCPSGGWAEDLPEAPGLLRRYPQLRATSVVDPAVRTRWNVRDSDATLVLATHAVVSPGTELTLAVARGLGRPYLRCDPGDRARVRDWLLDLGGATVLNVAGPRESECAGIQAAATALLLAVLRSLATPASPVW
jgi:hypothetical protein